jgi:hypothetical protein
MGVFTNLRQWRLARRDRNPRSGVRRLNGHPFLARGLVTTALVGAMALSFGVLGSSPAAPDTKGADTTVPAGNSGDTGNTGTAGGTTTDTTTTTTAPTTTTTTAPTTTTTTAPTTTTPTTTAPAAPGTTTAPVATQQTAGSINIGSEVIWDGNGTNSDGSCQTFQDDTDFDPIPNGDMAWLFILTQPGSAPYHLTTNLGNATPNLIAGSIHFILYAPLGSLLTSASATNGNGDNSVLTVSHCENGTPLLPTTISTTVFDATTGVQWSGLETVGAAASDTSSVGGVQEGTPLTGTVTYTFFTNGTCDGNGSAQTVDIADGVIPHSPSTLSLAAGSYSYTAVYNGDSNYAASTPSSVHCEPFSVADGPTSTATVLKDASTNQNWAGTETAGATAYDTSTVSGEAGGIVPTGMVTYSYFTNGTCDGTPVSTQQVLLNSDGSVPNSATTAPLAAGSYSFDAIYGGDSNYSASLVSSCEPFTVAAVTSPSTVTPTAGATTTPTTTTTTTPPATRGSAIAFTGADLAGMWASAVALLGLGGLLVLMSRKRRGQIGETAE